MGEKPLRGGWLDPLLVTEGLKRENYYLYQFQVQTGTSYCF